MQSGFSTLTFVIFIALLVQGKSSISLFKASSHLMKDSSILTEAKDKVDSLIE